MATRTAPTRAATTRPHFQAYNRNKRSLALDLKPPADRAALRPAARATPTSTSRTSAPAPPTASARAPKRLRGLNPRLVYCSISGFGADGPYVDRPSYDSVAQALSGFLSVVVDPERPRFLGPALADAITGIYAAYGVLGALFERARTGKGRLVEVSMLEAMAHFAVEPFAAYFALGEVPKSSDRPRLAQAHILRTATSGCSRSTSRRSRSSGPASTTALEAPELARRPALQRAARAHPATTRRSARSSTRGSAAARSPTGLTRLSGNDVPFAPINGIDAVVNDPQARHLGLVVPVEASHRGRPRGGAPRRCSSTAGTRRRVTAAPLLDQHGDAIRAALAGRRLAGRRGAGPRAGPRDDADAEARMPCFPRPSSAACRSRTG